jgi:TolB-like protein
MSLSVNTEPQSLADPQPATELRATRDSRPTTGKGRAGLIAGIFLMTAFALGVGLWTLSQRLAPQIAPVSPDFGYIASFPERSIAVLPFEDQGEASQDLPIAEAVHDYILSALSKVSDLRVISPTSVSGYAPKVHRNLRTISQDLGAGHILEGSVERVGQKVRTTVRLTDARRAVRLWNLSYERDLADLFATPSEIVLQVTTQLHATVLESEQAAIDERPTQDLEAYIRYVRAKALIQSVANAQVNQKLNQAVELLDEATARDPKFYLAWCQLGAAHNYVYFFGFDHSSARLALAQAALDTAIALRPDAGETHLAKANFLYRCFLDYDKAHAELAFAERALPNQSEVFELKGYIDRRQGSWPESARSLQRALELDPRNAFLLQQIAASYQEFRQFGAMAAALDRALALTPDDIDARVTRAFVDLECRGDTRPLHHTIDELLQSGHSASDFADQWLYLALCERDPLATARAVAAVPDTGIATDLNFPREYCQALAARASGDVIAAQTSLLAARAEVEKTVREQPDYGPTYTVLGLIDAGLGRKEEAMREGRRGIELLPITRNSIDGAELMKYLAVIYAWCGEKDLAVEQIAATLQIPSSLSYGHLKLHPYWDGLRGDPRFEKILADLAPKNDNGSD